MAKRQLMRKITSKNIGEAARDCAYIIRKHSKEDPCPREALAEEVNLTTGQLSTVIKYMRRCSENNLEKYIRFYPISSTRGYFFPKSFEDFAPYYATLAQWASSIVRTIKPTEKAMISVGINWEDYLPKNNPKEVTNYLEDIPEINKHTAWFYEEEED